MIDGDHNAPRIVRPYRGDRYGIEKPFGLSILILGESSYDKKGAPGLLPVDWNERIIGCVVRGERDLTIKRCVDVFQDEPPEFPGHSEFWRTAAFANFVQDNMGAPGNRPSNQQWHAGQQPFQRYFVDLRPQFVLVTGSELWSHLPTHCRKVGPSVRLEGEPEERQSYLYPNDDGYAFAFGIRHTSRGFSHRTWRPWVKAAMEQAIRFHDRPVA
jgi:hypothetical protein